MVEHETVRVTQVPEAGEAPLFRRLAAEFIGTMLLVAIGGGAAVVLTLGPLQGVQRLIEGQMIPPEQTGLFSEFLANGFGDILGVALAFGLILAVLIYAFGGVSGGHFNPAVTFALGLARRFSWKDVPLYWVAQCAGAVLGALIIGGIYGDSAVTFEDTNILLGATTVSDSVTFWQALLSEAAIGFVLMTAIMAIAVDPRAPKGWSGLIIGLSLTAGILLTGAATGGSANFARSLGPFVASWIPGLYEAEGIPWSDLGVYALGPLIGAAAAALLYESITGLERLAPAPGPGAATPANTLLGGVDGVDGDVHGGPGGGDDSPNPGSAGPYKGPR